MELMNEVKEMKYEVSSLEQKNLELELKLEAFKEEAAGII